MEKAARTVWFLVTPGTGILNVAGPWEVLGHTNDVLGREAYRLEAYGAGGSETRTRYGLLLGGLKPLPARARRPPDLAVVAGTPLPEPPPGDAGPFVPWLRDHQDRIPVLVSICTGAFALAAAGILDGRRATTHWLHLDTLRARYPAVRVVDDGVYVQDGPVWTSAGVTAGIDLALALVEEEHGHGVAMQVAKRMVLFLRRSGHQAQFSAALRRQAQEPPRLRDISAFVVEHIHEPLPVERVAEGVGMSPRTLSRWCRTHLDESPASLVRRIRIEEARRLLEATPLPLKDVTARAGLGDVSTFWRAFTHDFGVTPAEYRQRFAPSGA